MDPTAGNPEGAQGEAGATTASLTEVMSGMVEGQKPAAEPAGENGDNAKGSKDDSSVNPAWMNQLPEEYRTGDNAKQFAKFAKIADMAKAYSELESKIGNTVALPTEETSAEDLQKFYEKLGKPATADEYEMPDKEADFFKEIAFNNNLTKAQAKAVFDAVVQHGVNVIEQSQVEAERVASETDKALRTEYGPKYSEKIALLKRGIAAYGGNELGAKLQRTGLLYDRDVVKMFIALGEQNAEAGASIKGAGGGNNDYVSTSQGGHFKFD